MIPALSETTSVVVMTLAAAVGLSLLCMVLRAFLVTRVFGGEGGRPATILFIRSLLNSWFCVLFSLLISFRLFLPETYGAEPFLHKALLILLTVQGIIIVCRCLTMIAEHVLVKKLGKNAGIAGAVRVVKGVFVVVVLLFLFDNLGFDITVFAVGFGVGGIALAFMLRSILTHALALLTIKFTKPFAVRDTIIVRTIRGEVKHIGVMATQVKTERGDVVSVPNKDLIALPVTVVNTDVPIAISVVIPVPRTTPLAKMEDIPHLFEQVAVDTERVRFDHAAITAVDATSVSFTVTCHLEDTTRSPAVVQHNLSLAFLSALKQRSARKKGVEE